MRELLWSSLKSERLKRTRGASFEELTKGKFVALKEHPTRPQQQLLLFDYNGQIWVAPFVEQADAWFLKTAYPSRKYTALYQRGAIP